MRVPSRLPALLAAAFACNVQAAPLSSAFTYQGELYDSGQPAIGSFDLRFTPYADAANPSLLGPPVVVEDVLVSEGVFTAKVDFGAGFFVGDQVWLEVAVRPFDSVDPNAFQALAPRQELTASPYTLKPAPGSVTDVELAGDAVGSAQVADNSVGSADITDGSLTATDLDLNSLGTVFWRVGGNAGTAGAALGTTDSEPLSLVSPVGVTINGARANNNTELTIRGNPGTPETNADLSLWPRGGEAFFNIAAIPTPSNAVSTPANTELVLSSVGTNPFTGFLSRASFGFDGAFRVRPNNSNAPQPRMMATRVGIGFDPSDSSEAQELVLEDQDAQLGLYSANDGSAGSVITLGELDAGNFSNAWGLYRATSAGGNDLRLTFGTNQAAAANPILFHFGDNGSLGIGAPPTNGELEMQVTPSAANLDNGADLALAPRGGDHLFDLKVEGTNATDTSAALLFAGPSANFAPRMRVTGTGSFGAGKVFNLAHGGSFVFADDSSATPVATTASNQFLVRAAGGIGINSAAGLGDELTIGPHDNDPSTDQVDVVLGSPGSVGRFRISTSVAGASDNIGRLMIRNSNSSFSNSPILEFLTDGAVRRLGLFRGRTGGSWVSPAHPLHIGDPVVPNSGNGAHLTSAVVWTSASSRSFKHAFTAVDAGAILDTLLALPVTRWRYRGEDNAWHLGPVAEDFYAAFGLGDEEKYIGGVDADGVALAAIQGLAARAQERADSLASENAALRASLTALAARVQALERGD